LLGGDSGGVTFALILSVDFLGWGAFIESASLVVDLLGLVIDLLITLLDVAVRIFTPGVVTPPLG
jgi:hypothetical protein